MDALLAALEPRPGPARLLIVLAALLAVAALASLASARGAPTLCRGAEQAFGAVWDEAAQQRVHRAFAQSGRPYAETAYRAVDETLGRTHRAWVAMHTQACEATRVRGEQSEALLDLRVACLDDRRREAEALVRLFSSADAALVERAQTAVGALRPLDDCDNPRALRGDAPPPRDPEARARREALSAQLAEARALHAAGQYARALPLAVEGVARSRALDDRRLLGAFLLERGIEESEHFRYPDAEQTFHEAAQLGIGEHDDALQTDAWLNLLGLVGYHFERAEEAHRWAAYAEASLRNLGRDDRREARLYERLSLVEWSIEARLEEARAHYLRARALAKGQSVVEAPQFIGADHGGVLQDMGLYDQALAVHEANLHVVEAALGRDHPEDYYAAVNYAEALTYVGRAREAVPLCQDLLARFPWIRDGYARHRLAAALRGVGDPQAALAADLGAVEQLAESPTSLDIAPALTGQGLDLLLLGRPREALAPLERAASIRARARLATAAAETHFALARALWDSDADRPRARALAASARAAYAAAAERYGSTPYRTRAAEIEAWEHARPTP
jgi:tetratricopeptide (TPR) repeat protein